MVKRMQQIDYPDFPVLRENRNLCSTLRQNWEFTKDKLIRLNKALNEELYDSDIAVCVAGSYGRFEASELSDFDYIILKNEISTDDDKLRVENCKRLLEEKASELGIQLPNPDGVFSQSFSVNEMIERIGHKDDVITTMAQRILLLMECKPVFNEKYFDSVVKRVLDKYFELPDLNKDKEAVFLLNDSIRYFRSICVNYQFNFWREEEKWGLRNIKLRHSRVLMYGGLLLLICNASQEKHRQNKHEYIYSKIKLTPIERIIHVYEDNHDVSISRVLSIYNVFLGNLSSEQVRKSLIVDYESRYSIPTYQSLKVNSDFFLSELTRFILSKQNVWSNQIFEYLFF